MKWAGLAFVGALALSWSSHGVAQHFSAEYPLASLRAGEEGVVEFVVVVSEAGVPESCDITKSSGFVRLDFATCNLAMRRARYKPAVDANGTAIRSRQSSRIEWKIPDE
jgi:periplasmic protein TonB